MYSQQDTVTPRHSDRVPGSSPMRKKIRNISYESMNLATSNGLDFNSMSQDSNSLSQFSQDFSERLGQLSMRPTQEDFLGTAEDSLPAFDKFPVPALPSAKPSQRNNKTINTLKRASSIEPEMQIDLRPVHNNPFLNKETHPVEQYFQKYFYIPKRPLKLWIGAYKERSRYITDFEELTVLGEGTFSAVYSVRHRVDGTLYAIKKIKERVKSESHYNHLLREVCALSMLRNCPHMIQYYNSWVDDNQVYIQMELCHLGTLEDMITSIPSRCSIFRIINTPNANNITNLTPQERNRSDSYVSENNSIACTRTNSIGPNASGNLLLGGANLSLYNSSTRGISEEFAWFILKIVSESLEYMHQFNMVHLDIRPANIFIQSAHDRAWFDPESSVDGDAAASSPTAAALAAAVAAGNITTSTNTGLHSKSSDGTTTSSLAATTSLFSNVLKQASHGLQFAKNSAFSTASSSSKSISQQQQVKASSNYPERDIRTEVETSILKGEYCLKLGDLGHARHLEEHIPVIEGETRYCPRELIELDASNVDLRKCDIFSLGMSVYELCLGRFLGSQGEDGVNEWHSIRDGTLHETFYIEYTETFTTMIEYLINGNPFHRPTAEMIRQQSSKALTAIQQELPLPTLSPMIRQMKSIKPPPSSGSSSSSGSSITNNHHIMFASSGQTSQVSSTEGSQQDVNTITNSNSNHSQQSLFHGIVSTGPTSSGTSSGTSGSGKGGSNSSSSSGSNAHALLPLPPQENKHHHFMTTVLERGMGLPPIRIPLNYSAANASSSYPGSANGSTRTTPVHMDIITGKENTGNMEQVLKEKEVLQHQVNALLQQVAVLQQQCITYATMTTAATPGGISASSSSTHATAAVSITLTPMSAFTPAPRLSSQALLD